MRKSASFLKIALFLLVVMFSARPVLTADVEEGFTPILNGKNLNRAEADKVTFFCRADNDLYQVYTAATGHTAPRFDSPEQAVQQAPSSSGVLLLADGYPEKTTPVAAAVFAAAARKRLRLYVEYPAFLPGVKIERPRSIQWERTVVNSDAFGPSLPRLRILMVHGCHFLPVEAKAPHLALARVAGYDTAVFGLPKKDVWPILFEHPRGDILVAATKLSQFVTARYAPTDAWPAVWRMVFGWLTPGAATTELRWTSTVRPSYGRSQTLPADAERLALRRGVAWYSKARLLIHPHWQGLLKAAEQNENCAGPGATPEMPTGDGTLGILEGHSSRIDCRGRQPVRWVPRADCNSEAAMALALYSATDGDTDGRTKTIAANLVDFVLVRSNLQQGPRAKPESPSYGLLSFHTQPVGGDVYYGDENARAVLGQLATAAVLKSHRWDEAILRCVLGNFRTTGPTGFRKARILESELQEHGWRYFWERSDGYWGPLRHSGHYQAYLWAVNLWLYDKTRFEPLKQRTELGIRHMMGLFPDHWHWECRRQESERARMLLPLAWLVRVHDTPEHRRWLRQVARYVLDSQDASGAIREKVTGGETSNEQYGTGETPVIYASGDPCADLLYTTNFAFFGLHEAASATGDTELRKAEDRLADFLVRVQVRGDKPLGLDGAWFRGFDFRRWDYWGSNSDAGWGVWATETGWTQSWITSVFALRQLNTSFWDLTKQSKIGDRFERLRRGMLPDDVLIAE
jgi:hypothetical protein